MSIGLYDADWMLYHQGVFNLEILKLSSYYKRRNQITLIAPRFEPSIYTELFYRRDYTDDRFNFKDVTSYSNVKYGGLAFSNDIYIPMDLSIERMQPDTSIYLKLFNGLKDKWGKRKIKPQFNAEHFRLSLDGKTIWNEYEKQFIAPQSASSLYIHDPDIVAIDGARELLNDLVQEMPPITSGQKLNFRFPIHLSNVDELLKWDLQRRIGSTTILEYDGLLPDVVLYDFARRRSLSGTEEKFYYDVTTGYTEEEFLSEKIFDLYKQGLFMRTTQQKVLLNIRVPIFSDPMWYKVLNMIETFIFSKPHSNPNKYSLAERLPYFQEGALNRYHWTKSELREVFHFVQSHNYELFKLFYEAREVDLINGRFEIIR